MESVKSGIFIMPFHHPSKELAQCFDEDMGGICGERRIPNRRPIVTRKIRVKECPPLLSDDVEEKGRTGEYPVGVESGAVSFFGESAKSVDESLRCQRITYHDIARIP